MRRHRLHDIELKPDIIDKQTEYDVSLCYQYYSAMIHMNYSNIEALAIIILQLKQVGVFAVAFMFNE